MIVLLTIAFFLAAMYQAGKAEYWKRRAENPWDAAWRSFEKRQGLR